MPRFNSLLILSALLFQGANPAQAQTQHKVEAWLTRADRSEALAKQPAKLRFKSQPGQPATILVDEAKPMQSIDGFGFALTGGSAGLLMHMDASHRASMLTELFSTKGDGIGVSALRASIGSSDMNEKVFTYDDLAAGQTDATLTHFDLGPDQRDVVPVLQEILNINKSISILASPWSAPSWMKTNNNPKGGELKPEMYAVYAQYLIKYLQAMARQGITIGAITVQNEPLNPKNTPSMVMSAEQQASFIGSALGPALHKAGLQTKIILYDHNCDEPDYPLTILADEKASQYVAGSGFHLYGGTVDAMTKVHDMFPGKDVFFTEQMVTQENTTEPLHIAGAVSRVMIGATRNWSRDVLLWNLAADPKFGPHTGDGGCPVCQGAITIEGNEVTRNLAFYTMAQVSKFVPPGSRRIASDSLLDDLPNVAFATPDHRIVLVVANPSHAAREFTVGFRRVQFASSLAAGDVATYVWR